MSWRTIDSKVIAKDRWISLRADHCIDERGTEISPYYVLEYPDWVHIVCIDDAERICLIEQYRHGVGHSMFELPCGFVEPEEAPLAAAERELREETGIVASDWVSLGTFSPNPATHTNWVHLFGCRAVSHGPNAPEPTESLRSIFVTIDELERMIESGRFGQLLHLGTLQAARLRGFWG